MPLSEHAALSKDRTSGRNAKLQHRHFAFIADVLKSYKPSKEANEFATPQEQWELIVKGFGLALNNTNPAFDQSRFYKATGLK